MRVVDVSIIPNLYIVVTLLHLQVIKNDGNRKDNRKDRGRK